MAALQLSGDAEADALLSRDPFALLIGMVLDQQVPLERAFTAPLALKQRLERAGGVLAVAAVAAMPPEQLVALFCEKPALHRFPASMAERVQQLALTLEERFGGRAERVWTTAADGKELLARLRQLPGFGAQKAQIFLALLGKRLGVRPAGWEAAAGAFGEPGSHRSVADIDGPGSLALVREHKQQMKRAAKALVEATAAAATAAPAGRAKPPTKAPARAGRSAR